MIKQQRWRPDTHPELAFIQEYDSSLDAPDFICVRVEYVDGRLPVLGEQAQEIYDDALGLNQYKNIVVVPAILQALPADEKIAVKDEDGNETGEFIFKNIPSFKVENGELKGDFTSLKSKNRLVAQDILKIKSQEFLENKRKKG